MRTCFSENKEREGPHLTCVVGRPISAVHFDEIGPFVFALGRNESCYIYSLRSPIHLLQVITIIISYTVLCYLLDLLAA